MSTIRLMKHERQALKSAKDMLEPFGYKVSFEPSSKHSKIVCELDGQLISKKSLSSSPSVEKAVVDRTRQWASRILEGKPL